MNASVFPSDKELFPDLVPQPTGCQLRYSYFSKVYESEEEFRKNVNTRLDKYEKKNSKGSCDRVLKAVGKFPWRVLEVMEPWMDQYLKEKLVDSYPAGEISLGKIKHTYYGPDGSGEQTYDLSVDYLKGIELVWGLNEVDLETDSSTPGLHRDLHRLHIALHPIRLWKSFLRLFKCVIPLAVGIGLVWYFRLGSYMGTINTVRVQGFLDSQHVFRALVYDCLRLGGVLLIAIGGMSVLYGIIMLFHNVADWLRQKEYRRNRDMLALDAYRAVRFYQLWAANENRELDLHWAQAVLDEYAASKGG